MVLFIFFAISSFLFSSNDNPKFHMNKDTEPFFCIVERFSKPIKTGDAVLFLKEKIETLMTFCGGEKGGGMIDQYLLDNGPSHTDTWEEFVEKKQRNPEFCPMHPLDKNPFFDNIKDSSDYYNFFHFSFDKKNYPAPGAILNFIASLENPLDSLLLFSKKTNHVFFLWSVQFIFSGFMFLESNGENDNSTDFWDFICSKKEDSFTPQMYKNIMIHAELMMRDIVFVD